MIVSGVHLGDKKTAHVLLSYRTQQQPQNTPSPLLANTSFHKSPPHPRHRPSRLTQAGLRSSLQSADSGGQVLNASPLLVLQGSAVTLPPRYEPASGGGRVGGVEVGRLEAGRGAGTAPRPSLAQAEAGRLRRGALITRPTVSLPAVAQRGRFAALLLCHGIITPSPLPRSPAWHYHHHFK